MATDFSSPRPLTPSPVHPFSSLSRHPSATATATATAVVRKKRLEFSMTGLVYIAMTLFMAMAAMQTSVSLLFGVFGLMIGTLLISVVISRMVLRRLVLHRTLPELAIVGQTTTISYEFINGKRFWPSLSVSLAELDGVEAFTRQPQSYLLHAAARQSATVPISVIPKRRGLHHLERYQLSTSFPFGFIKRAVERRQKDSMLVYPSIGQVDPRFVAMCRSADVIGATMRPRRGGQDEFYGVKEHRSGENPRWIYWRRSARTGVLVAKEMTQVSPPRLFILMDTYIDPANRTLAAQADIERGIAMAASLASHALEAGLSVGLLAWSGEWSTVQPARGKRHRRDLLAALAQLPLNFQHPTDELMSQSGAIVESGATPVLISPREVQFGLSDAVRSGLVAASSAVDLAGRWFSFPPTVRFDRCMPADQEAEMNEISGVAPRARAKKRAVSV